MRSVGFVWKCCCARYVVALVFWCDCPDGDTVCLMLHVRWLPRTYKMLCVCIVIGIDVFVRPSQALIMIAHRVGALHSHCAQVPPMMAFLAQQWALQWWVLCVEWSSSLIQLVWSVFMRSVSVSTLVRVVSTSVFMRSVSVSTWGRVVSTSVPCRCWIVPGQQTWQMTA